MFCKCNTSIPGNSGWQPLGFDTFFRISINQGSQPNFRKFLTRLEQDYPSLRSEIGKKLGFFQISPSDLAVEHDNVGIPTFSWRTNGSQLRPVTLFDLIFLDINGNQRDVIPSVRANIAGVTITPHPDFPDLRSRDTLAYTLTDLRWQEVLSKFSSGEVINVAVRGYLVSSYISEFITLHGSWVKFNTQGGSLEDDIGIAYNNAYELPTPTRTGHGFRGWYDNPGCFGNPVSKTGIWSTIAPMSLTLHAKWEQELEYGIAWVTLQASGYYGYSSFEVYGVVGLGTVTGTDIVIPAYHNGVPVLGIADNAFENSNITSVTFEIGSQLLYIGELAFAGCEYLTHIIFPDGIVEIGWLSFTETGLHYVVVPESLTDFGKHAFVWSDNLTAIFYYGTQTQWQFINECDSFNNAPVYFYSEQEPTVPGDYWRWVDSVPTVWDCT